jgi:uncharacterized membrane protein YphA (DoxX/SURF4 family)
MAAILGGVANTGSSVLGAPALIGGACLLAGFLTPIAGGLIALGATGIAFSWFPLPTPTEPQTILMTIFVAVVAATVVLLGPGAWSVDARLFGRREIIIPRTSQSPKS